MAVVSKGPTFLAPEMAANLKHSGFWQERQKVANKAAKSCKVIAGGSKGPILKHSGFWHERQKYGQKVAKNWKVITGGSKGPTFRAAKMAANLKHSGFLEERQENGQKWPKIAKLWPGARRALLFWQPKWLQI